MGPLRFTGAVRAVATLAAGGVAAQAVVFLARPVLTRLYTPEAWGAVSVFVALAGAIATLATLRYEDAVPLPERDETARDVLALVLACAAVGAGVAALLLAPRKEIVDALGVAPLASSLPLVPAVALLYAWGNGAQAWLGRAHLWRAVAVAIGAQSVVTVAVQLSAPEAGAEGLVLGVAAGSAAFALVGVGRALARGALRGVTASGVARAARRYRRFPALGLPASALGQVGARLPPLALGAAFGAGVVGQVGLATMAVLVPLAFVSDAVGQVFGVRAAEAYREGALGPLARRTLGRLLAFVLPAVGAAALLGPELFAWVFGDEWRSAGVYARSLAPWLALAAVAPPLTRAFDAAERQDREVWAGALSAGGVALGLAVGAWLGTPGAAALALGVGGGMGRLGQTALAMSAAGVPVRVTLGAFSRPLAVGALALAPALVAQTQSAHALAVVLAAVGVGACWAWAPVWLSPEAPGGER